MATPEEVFALQQQEGIQVPQTRQTPEQVFEKIRGVPATVGGIQQAKKLTGEVFTDILNIVNRVEPGVDYESGVPDLGFRARLSRADTPEEVKNTLTEAVGEGNFRSDRFGAIVIQPQGLQRLGIQSENPRAIDENGLSLGDLADISGDAPAIAAATAAGIATGGALPAIVATGAAGFLGKLAGETGEQLAGENIQPLGEVVKEAGQEGALAAGGEGFFRTILGPLGRKILAPEAKRISPERLAIVEEARAAGLKPDVSQVTRAPILGRAQAIANRIFGDPNSEINSKALNKSIETLKGKAGPGVTSRVSLGESIQGDIKQARAALSKWSNDAYTQVDELMGSQPVIPTSGIKQVATDFLEELPKTKSGKIALTSPETTSQLRDIIDLPDNVTSAQMQAIRTRLFDAVSDNTLVPGISSKIARDLGKAANESFGEAVKSGQITGEAAQVLKAVGRRYGREIKKFQNAFIQRVVRDPKFAGSLDPEQIVSSSFIKGHSANLRRLMQVIPKDTAEKVRRVAMEDILKTVSRRSDDVLVDIFDGKRLLNTLDDFGRDTLNAMFGKNLTDDLYSFGRTTQFITQKQGQAGGLVAAGIATRPLQNLGRLIKFNVLSKLMNTEKGLQWLTTGFKAPKTRAGSAALSKLATQVQLLSEDNTEEQ